MLIWETLNFFELLLLDKFAKEGCVKKIAVVTPQFLT